MRPAREATTSDDVPSDPETRLLSREYRGNDRSITVVCRCFPGKIPDLLG